MDIDTTRRQADPGERVEAGPLPWRSVPSGTYAVAAVTLVLLTVGYFRTFHTLGRSWYHNANYSHGFLIFPVFLFLVWRIRRELAETPLAPSWAGLVPLLAGVLLQVVGLRGDVAIFQGWSFVLVAVGLVWIWFGRTILRRLAFPLAFLLFMVPLFSWFINDLSFRLKTIAAFGSVHLARAFGAEVTRQGMDLYLPTGMMTIEGACSGLNSLVALMALASLFAYMGTGSTVRRVVLFFCSIPVALTANIVRITSLCVYAAVTNTERATGLFHDIGGFVLFSVALLLLAGVKRVLRC